MLSRLSRLVAVAAGTLLVMAVTAGSTQAQQGSERGGSLRDALVDLITPAETARTPVSDLRISHKLCEDMVPPPSPSKA